MAFFTDVAHNKHRLNGKTGHSGCLWTQMNRDELTHRPDIMDNMTSWLSVFGCYIKHTLHTQEPTTSPSLHPPILSPSLSLLSLSHLSPRHTEHNTPVRRRGQVSGTINGRGIISALWTLMALTAREPRFFLSNLVSHALSLCTDGSSTFPTHTDSYWSRQLSVIQVISDRIEAKCQKVYCLSFKILSQDISKGQKMLNPTGKPSPRRRKYHVTNVDYGPCTDLLVSLRRISGSWKVLASICDRPVTPATSRMAFRRFCVSDSILRSSSASGNSNSDGRGASEPMFIGLSGSLSSSLSARAALFSFGAPPFLVSPLLWFSIVSDAQRAPLRSRTVFSFLVSQANLHPTGRRTGTDLIISHVLVWGTWHECALFRNRPPLNKNSCRPPRLHPMIAQLAVVLTAQIYKLNKKCSNQTVREISACAIYA